MSTIKPIDMKQLLFILPVILLAVFAGDSHAQGPHYKLRQVNSTMGMKSETTIYVKGKRKRTEATGMMGMPAPPVLIEQCDLQRYIKLNDKKKLYLIEPFGKDEVIDDDAKPAAVKTKPVVPTKTTTQKGGTINMWYNISDTGERKKMNGFVARHVWTTQKMKPSPDACMMKDSMIIKTDGWYIDLPEFNCPVRYTPSTSMQSQKYEPECKDQFVSHRSGKGKLGFPLTETRTIILGGSKTTEMTTSLETLEFSTPKLDSMLFEIPPGYQLAASEEELQNKMDMADMMNQYKNAAKENMNTIINPSNEKKPGVIRIGVFEPKGDGQIQQPADLQQHLVGILSNGTIEAVAIAIEDDARKYSCDYILTTDFVRIKSGSKVGGLLKAIKNTDPNAASSFNIEANMTLTSVADGSTKLQPKVNAKYDGKIDDAAKKALDDGGRILLKGLK
jgi:hypothetical protein